MPKISKYRAETWLPRNWTGTSTPVSVADPPVCAAMAVNTVF